MCPARRVTARVPERLGSNLRAVEARLDAAAVAAGRRREDLVLVAVSKTRPASDIAALAALGVADFGESRWQELSAKNAELAGSAAAHPGAPSAVLRWHYVGRLQRNKARSVAAVAAAVHSLDRVELCGPLARGAAEAGRVVEVFLQVSLDGDPSRGGVAIADLPALADEVAGGKSSLRLAGLMAVPPLGAPPEPAFALLHDLSAQIRVAHPGAGAISAGMSGDLEAAVAAGATHLRIGTALFGSRA
jgi:pyridoxal phosphate enzyme (YggS family)